MGEMEKIRFRLKIKIWPLLGAVALFLIFPLPVQAVEMSVNLTKLAPVVSTKLYGAQDSYTVKIPIPDRWKINRAVLKFSYVNSTALIRQNSRLVVWLNERPLTQITLDSSSPGGQVSVLLPARLLKPGYDDLRFSVSQHYTNSCEDPTAPELWTTLALDRSSIDFDYTLKTVPLSLSAVNFLFDARIFSTDKVNLAVEDLSREEIEAAAIAAMGISVRFDYRPVHFSLSGGLKPGCDNIVIGDKSFVTRITGNKHLNASGPLINIFHMPGDDAHALITVQGSGGQQLKKSARAFASLSFPLPDSPSMRVQQVAIARLYPLAGNDVLIPGHEYAFRDIGFKTATFQGMGCKPGDISIKLPDGIMPQSNSYVRLGLHLAYGGGMRKDSVLNVSVNGKFVSAIYLDNQSGTTFADYRIDIPAGLFRSGKNTVRFTPVLTPMVTHRCEFIQTGNLVLTLFDDSTVQIPSMANWTAMPRIDLFAIDGFPFTEDASMKDTLVYLPEKNSYAAAAAINLLAMAAQKDGFPGYSIHLTYSEPKGDGRNVITVGTVNTLPEKILKAMPAQIGKDGLLPYPLIKDYSGEKTILSARLDAIIGKVLPPPVKNRPVLPDIRALVREMSEPGGQWVFLAEFESPYKSGRSVLLLTAISSPALYNGSDALLEPSVQGRCTGGLVVLDPSSPEKSIVGLDTGETYYVGGLGLFPRLNALIYEHDVLFFLLLLGSFGVLTRFAYLKLKAMRAQRDSDEEA